MRLTLLTLLTLGSIAAPAAQAARHVTLAAGDSLTLPAALYDIGLAADASEFWVVHLGGDTTRAPLSNARAYVPAALADSLDQVIEALERTTEQLADERDLERLAAATARARADSLQALLDARPPPSQGIPEPDSLRIYSAGYRLGYDNGRLAGIQSGRREGEARGREDGYRQARAEVEDRLRAVLAAIEERLLGDAP